MKLHKVTVQALVSVKILSGHCRAMTHFLSKKNARKESMKLKNNWFVAGICVVVLE